MVFASRVYTRIISASLQMSFLARHLYCATASLLFICLPPWMPRDVNAAMMTKNEARAFVKNLMGFELNIRKRWTPWRRSGVTNANRENCRAKIGVEINGQKANKRFILVLNWSRGKTVKLFAKSSQFERKINKVFTKPFCRPLNWVLLYFHSNMLRLCWLCTA